MRVSLFARAALALCGVAGALFPACQDGTSTPRDLSSGPADMASTNVDMAVSLTAPVVTSIDLKSSSTSGGGAATITGSRFAAGATVTIGIAAANVISVSPDGTSISINIPASPGRAGVVDVVVNNPNGEQGALLRGFRYFLNNVTFANATVNPTLNVSSNAGPRSIIQLDACAN